MNRPSLTRESGVPTSRPQGIDNCIANAGTYSSFKNSIISLGSDNEDFVNENQNNLQRIHNIDLNANGSCSNLSESTNDSIDLSGGSLTPTATLSE